MALAFRKVSSGALREFDAAAPDGVVIGIVGENGSGKGRLLRLAAEIEQPESGTVEMSGAARLLGPLDALDLSPTPVLLLEHTLATQDALAREKAVIALDGLRRAGTTALLVSHEEELLLRLADEVWWLERGSLAGRGDPAAILDAYRRRVAECVRAWGSRGAALAPRVRRGDGRAEVVKLETIGEDGRATAVWRSGELALVRVTVRFREPVESPVVGMMIRTRIGLNVYGTNTELEKLALGPCRAGDQVEISFGFRCELCPGEYTLTVASHDPDGVWHDWLEDALAFSVSDTRYTAGVANLRATASMRRL